MNLYFRRPIVNHHILFFYNLFSSFSCSHLSFISVISEKAHTIKCGYNMVTFASVSEVTDPTHTISPQCKLPPASRSFHWTLQLLFHLIQNWNTIKINSKTNIIWKNLIDVPTQMSYRQVILNFVVWKVNQCLTFWVSRKLL